MHHNEKVREFESRLSKLECKVTDQKCDDENQTVLLSYVDSKMEELSDSLKRVHLLEQRLNVKMEESFTREVPKKTSRPIQIPPHYDGNTPWEAYSVQFDIVAQINGWSREETA